MTSLVDEQRARPDPSDAIPLENGDRLTRAEFERRYAAMPNSIKAELVEGVVYVSSPVSNWHGSPHFDLITWLGMYRITTPGVLGSGNGTVRMDLDNEPQPDVFLRLVPECGGQCLVDEDNYIEGAPELIAEVANTTASYDLHSKLDAYLRNQVREYLVWRVRDTSIDWFRLHEGEFVPLAKDTAGVFKSVVFPGLWLDPDALIQADMAKVAEVAQQGLASEEHVAFVARLKKALAGAS